MGSPVGEAPAPLVTLRRVAVRPEGAFGVLLWHATSLDYVGTPFAVTLERTYDTPADAGVSEPYPQGDGTTQYVKVQRGRWTCVRRWFVRGGYITYEVLAPGHDGILFHKGGVEEHSEGCVLVARYFTAYDAEPGVGDADAGLAALLGRLAGRNGFVLEVA